MVDRVAELESIVAKHDLNQHPFYSDWRAGTLPVDKLRDYAGEYGRFVALIAQGWETLGEEGYANEERVHEGLWKDFQAAIGSEKRSNRSKTELLLHAANTLFAPEAEAVGALYAFEAQQPITSRTKLEGLEEHYNLDAAGTEYFRVHADDVHEVKTLEHRIGVLSDEEFARAKTACSILCAAMWGALDGVYYSA